MSDSLFWVGQKAFIKKRGKVLVLTDALTNQIDFPGGRIQDDEANLEKSLQREIKEEIGINVKVERPLYCWIRKFPKTHKYHGKKVFLVGIKCKFLSGTIKMTKTHTKFVWAGQNDLENLNDGSKYFDAFKHYFLSKDN